MNIINTDPISISIEGCVSIQDCLEDQGCVDAGTGTDVELCDEDGIAKT